MVKLEDEYLPLMVRVEPRWTKRQSRLAFIRKCITYPVIFVLSGLVLYNQIYGHYPKISYHFSKNSVEHTHPLSHLDSGAAAVDESEEPVAYHEIFEVAAPIKDYGVPVYTQTLLSHYVFANSWGAPAVVKYTPPPAEYEFNKVVFTISTTVNGVQYDRLAHLYLNDVQVWRTSTAEPGGREVISNSSKDLSDYLVLLKEEGQLSYQLDNLVNSNLNGAFNVSIYADYYNFVSTEASSVGASMLSGLSAPSNSTLLNRLSEIFSVCHHAPTSVIPLTANKDSTPLRYLPNDDFSYSLSALSNQTVAAVARLFISGNAAEEFWYSNALEDVKHKFDDHGHSLLGKGPVRVVKVYLNDYLVALESPKPVIFTGGISPSLWNPVVGINALDLGHIDINLTPYLPLLWSGSNELKVEVHTGPQSAKLSFFNVESIFDTEFAPAVVPGQNWISSGSLLTWENPNITYASGSVPNATVPTKKEDSLNFGSFTPNKANQIVDYKESVYGVGLLEFAVNGSEPVSFALNSSYYSKFANIQGYKKFGDDQNVISSIKNSKTLSVLDSNLTNVVDFTLDQSYITIMDLKIAMAPEISYNVSLIQVDATEFSGFNKPLYSISRAQNGSSIFYLSPNGNHGTGSLDTKLKIKNKINPAGNYKRKVKAVNGEVVSDKVKVPKDATVLSPVVSVDNSNELDEFVTKIGNFVQQYKEGVEIPQFF